MGVVPYFAMFAVALAAFVGVSHGGLWSLSGLLVVFVAVPALDVLMGINTRNQDEGATSRVRRRWYDLPLWLWVPAQLGMLGWLMHRVAAGDFSPWEIAAVAVSIGVINGAGGITIGHELMHRASAVERALAEVLMASVSYTHFCIEHVHGHHRNVSTPDDPATARLGEGVYRFYLRCVVGSVRSAWRFETERARRKGLGPFSLRDRRFRYVVSLIAVYAAIALIAGPMALVFFAAQSLVAFSLLEVVNYVEHYGLARRQLPTGQYEKVRPEHSWNASQRLTNWLLFNLSRHSDHHYLASRPYERLRHYDDVPQLPAGYATMVLVALVPPLWRRVMDARVAQWNERLQTASAATGGASGALSA